MALTAAEKERGWVEYKCPEHGFLVATLPCVKVTCSCGKLAVRYRNGRRVKKP